jgi:hypothetical protein
VDKGHGQRLSRDQERAISALLTSPSIAEASARCGVHGNTLRTWLKHPPFAAAYAEAKKVLLERTIARLEHSLFAVTSAMETDLTNPDPAVRRQAAELLSNNAIRMAEINLLRRRLAKVERDAAARIAALEQAMGEGKL